jgi:DNA invertase Pin-like site-specific DNA recombinase
MPEAYGYIRVSHEEQKESGLSLEAQEQQCRRFWERQLKPIGVTWANFMADEAVSAFKRALFRRPQGQLLLLNLHSGDHLIITRFDRVFRSMEDFITAYKLLQTRGVMIHILDAPGDPNTANGRAMLQLLCVFAEWSSRITSERNQAVVAILRQQGRPVSGTPPWGFQIVGPQGARRLEPDWDARAMMERIVRLHDIEGQGWAAIAQRIRADQAAARRHQLGEALRLCAGSQSLLANRPERGAGLDQRHRSPPPCRVPGQQAVDPNRPAVKLDRFDFCHEAPVRRKGVGLLHGVHHARLSGRF